MLQQWQCAMLLREDGLMAFDYDFDVPYWITEIDTCVQQVLRSDKSIFEVLRYGSSKQEEIYVGKLGKRLIHCLKADLSLIKRTYPKHKLSLYVELFSGIVIKNGLEASDFVIDGPVKLKKFIQELRDAAKAANLKKLIVAEKQAVSDNEKSLRRYLKYLFDYYDPILVVRIDLGFSKELRELSDGRDINSEYVRRSFQSFIKHLDRNVPAMVGYLRKLEYSAFSRYRFHLLVFFDGSKVVDDFGLGNIVGDYWVKITKGNGNFWNLSKSKTEFLNNQTLGIGMIRRSDKELRSNLERLALYLVKIDYYVRLNWPPRWKTFTHGVPKAMNSGRRARPPSFKKELKA